MLRCKDDCCGQDKLIHASSKQALKAELSGLNTPEFQCSELSELSFSEITKDLQKRDRVWLMDSTAKTMWRLYHYYLLNWVHFGHEKALEKFHFNNAYLMFQDVNKFPKLCIRANLIFPWTWAWLTAEVAAALRGKSRKIVRIARRETPWLRFKFIGLLSLFRLFLLPLTF